MYTWEEYCTELAFDFPLHIILSGKEKNLIPRQYTGLKDKNGKEIYEGDVLRYNYRLPEDVSRVSLNDFFGVVEYHTKILEIRWENDETLFVGFILKGKEGTGGDWFTSIPDIKDIEVIGNIHENPELVNSG